MEYAEILGKMALGKAAESEIARWKQSKRESLYGSFNKADVQHDGLFQRELEMRVLADRFIYQLSRGTYYEDALKIFGSGGISESIYENLTDIA